LKAAEAVCSNCGASAMARAPGGYPQPASPFRGVVIGSLVSAILIGGWIFFLLIRIPGDVQVPNLQVDQADPENRSEAVLSFGAEGSGPGRFTEPSRIGVDAGGRIYVGEQETGRIQVFDENGVFIRQWSFQGPDSRWLQSMSVSRDGTVYIVTGSELHTYDGETGELLGALEHFDGWGFDDVFACPDGSVLATWYRNRDDIVRFGRDGSIDIHIREAISGITGDPEPSTRVVADGLGNIHVYGVLQRSVFTFRSDGSYVNRFGSAGNRPGQFTAPGSIAVDDRGNVWVSDFHGLLVFDPSGLYLGLFDPGFFLRSMVIGDGNRLYGLTGDSRVIVLNLDGYLDSL